ncbi:coagulation factor II (thrombin) receptor-like 1, tandem duplicate 2 [Lepisosteus oculatus]|uniref:F2R like trypsin receptor 1 n=1 Tax=Lepisosteus oculatus TaxID=7918 RepID=W5MEE2_LEPOC|nr:PREDICTED: proteinase-activated receptor 2-like [Lepisosteus oculatus]
MFSVKFKVIFLLSSFISSYEAGSSRGFIGTSIDEKENVFKVNKIAEETLQSGLTTVFLPIVYIIVFVVSLPTNAMAIWVFLFRTKKKHPAAIYMANLALSDLLFVIWLPLKIAYHINGNNWIYGEGLCKVLVGFFYANMYCSILFITCLSVQRYWVIAHPLSTQRKNNRFAVCLSIAIWILIWLSTTPLYLYDQTVKIGNLDITTCHDVNKVGETNYPFGYFITMGIFAYFIPSLIIVAAYFLLLRTLSDSISDENTGKKRRKAFIIIITVLVTFLICFTPSNIMLVAHYSLLKQGFENNVYGFYIITLCLASLNSCLDPFIYYFVSKEFRDSVKNTLICRSARTVERMRVSFSSMKYSKRNDIYTSSSGSTNTSSC